MNAKMIKHHRRNSKRCTYAHNYELVSEGPVYIHRASYRDGTDVSTVEVNTGGLSLLFDIDDARALLARLTDVITDADAMQAERVARAAAYRDAAARIYGRRVETLRAWPVTGLVEKGATL